VRIAQGDPSLALLLELLACFVLRIRGDPDPISV